MRRLALLALAVPFLIAGCTPDPLTPELAGRWAAHGRERSGEARAACGEGGVRIDKTEIVVESGIGGFAVATIDRAERRGGDTDLRITTRNFAKMAGIASRFVPEAGDVAAELSDWSGLKLSLTLRRNKDRLYPASIMELDRATGSPRLPDREMVKALTGMLTLTKCA